MTGAGLITRLTAYERLDEKTRQMRAKVFIGFKFWIILVHNYILLEERPTRRENVLFLKVPFEGLGTSRIPIE